MAVSGRSGRLGRPPLAGSRIVSSQSDRNLLSPGGKATAIPPCLGLPMAAVDDLSQSGHININKNILNVKRTPEWGPFVLFCRMRTLSNQTIVVKDYLSSGMISAGCRAGRSGELHPHGVSHRMDILVATPGKADDNGLVLRQGRRQLQQMGNGMGRLQGRQNPLFAGQ